VPNEFRLWTGIIAPGIGILIHVVGLTILGQHVFAPAAPAAEPAWWHPVALAGLAIIAVRIIVLSSAVMSSVRHQWRRTPSEHLDPDSPIHR
jgi:tellurite resistance protein TehA-like permease